MKNIRETTHFSIVELAEGVYAALHNGKGAAFSNAGIIDLGGRTVVFDTTETLSAGKELARLALELTGNPASIVIISHHHNDHWMGNQAFCLKARIYCTEPALQAMRLERDELNDRKEMETYLRRAIKENESAARTEKDPKRIALLESAARRNRYALEELDELAPRLTERVIKLEMRLKGQKRQARILPFHPAHTTGDCILLLDREKIAFIGDLGFFKTHPFMGSCIPLAWIDRLKQLEDMQFNIYVPGHGPVGTTRDLARQREYIQVLGQRVTQALVLKRDQQFVLEQPLPDFCAEWEPTLKRYQRNVEFLFEFHKKSTLESLP